MMKQILIPEAVGILYRKGQNNQRRNVEQWEPSLDEKSAGSKFIKLVATAGTVESRITRTENLQNIPKSALENLMAAVTNAFFKNLSIARKIPTDQNPNQIVRIIHQTKANNF
ncbi:hypothetical protein ACFX2G_023409 [Malus domestica]